MTDPAAERLKQRYPRSRLPRPVRLALVGVLAAVSLAWLVWTATVHSNPEVSGQVVSFQIVSDSRIDVTLTVDRPDPSVPASCLLIAQAPDFDRVAEEEVAVGPSAERLVDVTVSLTTIRRATSASIRGCQVSE